ncbi:T9SS type A sorting domain-containing protein [bacterium]|nr:T9SS type A sorting domain-containing protein [bacterium]
MNWGSRLVATGVLATSVLLVAASVLSRGAPAGRTGAPGDLTCADAGCHVSNPVNTGDGMVQVTGPATYTPGTPVDLVLHASRPGALRFGFQITVRDQNGQMAGEWEVTDGTQFADFGLATAYLTHAAFAPRASDTYQWSVKWIPPSTAAGDLTFYAAANTANGDDTIFGDFIYTTSLPILYSGNTAVEEHVTPRGLKLDSVFPNPAKEQFTARIELDRSSIVTLHLYDNLGRIRSSIQTPRLSAGNQDIQMRLPDLSPGTYSFRLEASGFSQMGVVSICC